MGLEGLTHTDLGLCIGGGGGGDCVSERRVSVRGFSWSDRDFEGCSSSITFGGGDLEDWQRMRDFLLWCFREGEEEETNGVERIEEAME